MPWIRCQFLLWFFALGVEVRLVICFYKKKFFPLNSCSAGDQLYKTPRPYIYPPPSIPLHYDFLRTATLLRYNLSIYNGTVVYITRGQPGDSYTVCFLKICRSSIYLLTNAF
jgi:hypothetical protein